MPSLQIWRDAVAFQPFTVRTRRKVASFAGALDGDSIKGEWDAALIQDHGVWFGSLGGAAPAEKDEIRLRRPTTATRRHDGRCAVVSLW